METITTDLSQVPYDLVYVSGNWVYKTSVPFGASTIPVVRGFITWGIDVQPLSNNQGATLEILVDEYDIFIEVQGDDGEVYTTIPIENVHFNPVFIESLNSLQVQITDIYVDLSRSRIDIT